ncbi:hypothetical protein HDK64DRAFT_274198 [Phyllosticta capitalensis]
MKISLCSNVNCSIPKEFHAPVYIYYIYPAMRLSKGLRKRLCYSAPFQPSIDRVYRTWIWNGKVWMYLPVYNATLTTSAIQVLKNESPPAALPIFKKATFRARKSRSTSYSRTKTTSSILPSLRPIPFWSRSAGAPLLPSFLPVNHQIRGIAQNMVTPGVMRIIEVDRRCLADWLAKQAMDESSGPTCRECGKGSTSYWYGKPPNRLRTSWYQRNRRGTTSKNQAKQKQLAEEKRSGGPTCRGCGKTRTSRWYGTSIYKQLSAPEALQRLTRNASVSTLAGWGLCSAGRAVALC